MGLGVSRKSAVCSIRCNGTSEGVAWPSRSTIAELLKREGLSAPPSAPARERARRDTARTPAHPNALWTFDFKGQFLTGDHRYRYPLTTTDLAAASCCSAWHCPNARRRVERHSDALMRELGCPKRSTATAEHRSQAWSGRLSRLSLHWLKLGIA